MDRRGSRFEAETLAQLLGIPGDITHIEFNHKINMVEVFFRGNGSFQTTEGCESCIRTPEAWRQWDEEHAAQQAEQLEEGLEKQWESDQ